MSTKKHKASPGLDYAPITGTREDLSFGIVQAAHDMNMMGTVITGKFLFR